MGKDRMDFMRYSKFIKSVAMIMRQKENYRLD